MKKFLLSFFLMISILQICEGAGYWSDPITLSSGLSNATDPQVDMDGSGNSYVVWIENNQVQFNYRPAAGSWGTAVSLSSNMSTSPRIAVDPAGNATVIWVEDGYINTIQKPFGGSWGSVVVLSSMGASSPQIAVNPTGSVVAVWERNGGIESSTQLFGGLWSLFPDVITSSGDSPQVALGADNLTVVVVWHAVVALVDKIYAATKVINLLWSAGVPIATQSTNAKVAVDASGNALAVWFNFQLNSGIYSNVQVQSAYLPNGGEWGTATTLSNPGIYKPSCLVVRVEFDASGNAMIVWNNSYDGSTFIYEAINRSSTGTYGSVLPIGGDSSSYSIDLVLGPNGLATVVNMFNDNATNLMSIRSAVVNISSYVYQLAWSISLRLSNGDLNGFPVIAGTQVGGYARGVSAWVQNNGGINNIVVSNALAPLFTSPTGGSVAQYPENYGITNKYYNVLTWNPIPNPQISGYYVFRNNILIADVSTPTYTDRNRLTGETGNYQVAGHSFTGFQTPVLTIPFPP